MFLDNTLSYRRDSHVVISDHWHFISDSHVVISDYWHFISDSHVVISDYWHFISDSHVVISDRHFVASSRLLRFVVATAIVFAIAQKTSVGSTPPGNARSERKSTPRYANELF
ncbi:hypothetical protein ACQKMV_00195 [Lysinibacillus sp. NPDC094403]|uniref:hypothetical protein n=1 Tax=Lysinibacillus sp. NPDC094403 TaxID=3390581 RepID=UPI003D062C71